MSSEILFQIMDMELVIFLGVLILLFTALIIGLLYNLLHD